MQLLQAAGGQGAAEAKLFTQEGEFAVATDMQTELLGETWNKINSEFGDKVIGLIHDVASEEDWQLVVSETLERFGKVGVLVNNAGISGSLSTNLDDYSVADWEKVLNVNTVGNFLGMKAVAPEMKKNGSGSIINISSIAGIVGGQGGLAYQASKGATRVLTKAVTVDLASSGIRVNSIHPGAILTPMLEGAINAEVQEVVRQNYTVKIHRVTRRYCISCTRFMTGAELVIDGGTIAL